jgi:hypothetical protein
MLKTIDPYKASMQESKELKEHAGLAIKYVQTIAPYKIVVETPEKLKECNVALSLHNEHFNIYIYVIKEEILNRKYQNQFFCVDKRTDGINFELYPHCHEKRWFDFPDESVIACASKGNELAFLLKNGLLLRAEITKNDTSLLKEGEYFKEFSFAVTSHLLYKEIEALDLNETNCVLKYNDSLQNSLDLFLPENMNTSIKETFLSEKNEIISPDLGSTHSKVNTFKSINEPNKNKPIFTIKNVFLIVSSVSIVVLLILFRNRIFSLSKV